MVAIRHNNRDMIDFLLSHGCDINHSNHEGDTALMIAADNGLVEVVEYLVREMPLWMLLRR